MEENKKTILMKEGTEQEKHTQRMRYFYDLFNQIKEQDPNFNIMVLSTTKDSTGKELGVSFLIGDVDKLGVEFSDCLTRYDAFKKVFWKAFRNLHNKLKFQRK